MTVDFLIQPSLAGDKGGKLRDIEPDFAAIIAPGLRCAFQDRQRVTLEGREVWVCGAGPKLFRDRQRLAIPEASRLRAKNLFLHGEVGLYAST